MTLKLQLHSFVRQGLAAMAVREEGQPRASVAVPVRVVGEQGQTLASAPSDVARSVGACTLRGPGDVAALAPAAIARVHPAPGAREAPCNQLAFVELRAADLLWRYTPEVPQDGKLAPWLVLLVLPAQAGALETRAVAGRSALVLRVPSRFFEYVRVPDEPWAWAHAQTVPAGGAGAEESPACCRLMSPLRLAPHSSYRAVLAPAYEAGRLAGLGQLGAAQPLAAAHLRWWQAEGSVFELPVFHHWEFDTAGPDDTAALLGALGPDHGGHATRIGHRRIDGSQPGLPTGERPAPQAAQFELEGALLPWRAGALAEEDATVAAQLREALRQEQEREPPSIALPLFGEAYLGGGAAQPEGWIAHVNLTRRLRVLASVGAEAVRRHQQELVAACWRAAGELRQANARVRSGLVGGVLSARVAERHLTSLAAGRAWLVMQPVLDLLSGGDSSSAAARVARSALGGDRLSFTARRTLWRRAALGRAGRAQAAARLERLAAGPSLPSAGRAQHGAGSPLRAEAAPLERLDLALAGQLRPLEEAARRVHGAVRGGAAAGPLEGALRERVTDPVLRWSLASAVAELELELLAPGLGALAPETITVFRENPQAIAAFVLGANHEFLREARWRELALAPTASPLRMFWEATSESPEPDVPPLAERAREAAASAKRARAIFAVRGQAVRRMPDLVATLVGTSAGDDARALLESALRTGADSYGPAFREQPTEDLLLLGWPLSPADLADRARRWWLVIGQPPIFPCFGLAPAAPGPVDDPGAAAPAYLSAAAHGGTSAAIAAALHLPPVARALPVEPLLYAPEGPP